MIVKSHGLINVSGDETPAKLVDNCQLSLNYRRAPATVQSPAIEGEVLANEDGKFGT